MSITGLVASAVGALGALSIAAAELGALDDAEFLSLATASATIRRLSDAHAAAIAGETARRSARELGHSGLAQRMGYRTPQELVRATTGSTASEALAAVRVGTLDGSSPIAAAVGPSLSISAADAIARGLGEPSDEITRNQLTDAAAELIDKAGGLDADRLYRLARQMRDELDLAGVADREAQLFGKRALRVMRQADGMTRLVWIMDPETAASVGDLYDRVTSPRRGGSRFVSGDSAALASRIAEDPRTTEQLSSDVFLALVRSGADADSSELLATGAPIVSIVATTLDRDAGAAADGTVHAGVSFIEGQSVPVSIATLERAECAGGVRAAQFDQHGQPLDLGRTQRLFSAKQRVALALRDGGCMFDGCTAPPSWTEAHHIESWAAGQGRTDIANGILLCRFHHLLLHNNRWQIRRERGGFWLVPPPDVDPSRTPRPMISKSRALRRPA